MPSTSVAIKIRSQQGFQLLLQLMVFGQLLLALFPVDAFPNWLQTAAQGNPLTYGIGAIRQIFLDQSMAIDPMKFSSREAMSTAGTAYGRHMSITEKVVIIGRI